jgi:hypothetical protein
VAVRSNNVLSQNGHENRQTILFRTPVTRPIYGGTGTGILPQERVILASLETIFILSKPEYGISMRHSRCLIFINTPMSQL